MSAGRTVVWVAANFDDPGDGVGKYTARMVEAVRSLQPGWRTAVATGRTTDLRRWRRFFSVRMAGCLLAVARRIEAERVDAVVVEYPFLEQSPAILPAMCALRRVCTRTGAELVLSLHEYRRVGRLRQWSIRHLAGLADKVFATDEATASELRCWARGRVWVREIPSNIPQVIETHAARDPGGFCFFGVVNRSKAVAEMIEGWRLAWKPGMTIHVLSASAAGVCGPGVVYHRGLSDMAVAQVLAENSFQVLPILPTVETNSGSLKAGQLNGLIPIGLPGTTVGDWASSFVAVEAYTPECFARAFQIALGMSDAERACRRNRLLADSARWSVENSARQVVEALLSPSRQCNGAKEDC